MGRACCILGCSSGADVPSHQIPKNPVLFKKWKNIIYSSKIEHLTDEQISKCVVCYRHFATEDYLVTFRVRKLKRGIAPSLNLPNQPITDSCGPNIVYIEVKQELETSEENMIEIKQEMVEDETGVNVPEETHYSNKVALFEDLPETLEPVSNKLESYIFEQSPDISLNESTEQIVSTTTLSKSNHRVQKPRKKQVKLTTQRLALFQRKKQAKQYERTSTVQKLLSHLTPADKSSIQIKIQRSKYSPKIYVKMYHDIAKRKALGQL